MFRPNLHLQESRISIEKWDNFLKATHYSSDDGRLKTTLRIRVQTLYQRLILSTQQSIVDEAQAKEVIDFHQTDDPREIGLLKVNSCVRYCECYGCGPSHAYGSTLYWFLQ